MVPLIRRTGQFVRRTWPADFCYHLGLGRLYRRASRPRAPHHRDNEHREMAMTYWREKA
jgi:hypothetical protein